jgi:hypothetical protein
MFVKAKQQFGTIFVKWLSFSSGLPGWPEFFRRFAKGSVQNRNSGGKNQAEIPGRKKQAGSG